MSVIIRLQNLPWSANALDIRNFFRGLSIPEGGVHIVGGELGDAFIAFSTDEDARQAMMLGGGKIKEIQVNLHLSSRSEMHKVIETARQTVPILTLTAPAPAPTPPAPQIQPPIVNPFAAALGASNPLASFGIPGLGNPLEIPQPAVIEPPARLSISPPIIITPVEKDDDDRVGPDPYKRKEKDRRRSRSRSRSREKKDRKRDRRDRSRSRESRRNRRDRSRSRDRRGRKRDRKDRSRSRDFSPSRNSRDRREERRSPNSQPDNRAVRNTAVEQPPAPPPPVFNNTSLLRPNYPAMQVRPQLGNGQNNVPEPVIDDPIMADTYNRLQELGKKRNPNAFQGEQNGGPSRFHNGGGGLASRGGRRESHARGSRFEPERDSCVAIRNAPNHTSYGDVRRFFPFMIDKHGIKMINDNMGHRTGNIFVRFCEPRSKQLSLQRRNNELKGQEVTVEHLDDEVYESAIDSFLPFREEREEAPAPVPPAPEPEPFTVVRLSDLPNHVKEHDIIKIFSDYSLLSIMLTDCRKTRTRSAYVQFVKPEDAKQAFARREQYVFGRRQATVEPLSNEEYDREKAMQSQVPPALPAPAQAPPSPEPVVPRDPRQRREPPAQPNPNYFAPPFVQTQPTFPQSFPNQFPPNFIAPGGPRANIDPRGPPVWGVRAGFAPPALSEPDNRQPMENESLDCVLIKGLPRDATDRNIVQFLSDTGAVPTRIHLMLDPSGVPSGDCFCEFRSVGDARRALAKHAQELDGCRVTVDLVGREVVEDALEGPKILDRSLLGDAPPPMMAQFFDNPRGGFGGRGGFRGRGGFDRGFDRGYDRGGRGMLRGRGGFDRGRGAYEGRGRGFDRGPPRGGFGGRLPREDLELDMNRDEGDPALQDFGAPGCVVSMENVPFRATVEDILRFFGDFELTQDDVIRRFNEKGQPTGDARVAFQSPFIAQKAAKNHNFDMILDRRISLSIL